MLCALWSSSFSESSASEGLQVFNPACSKIIFTAVAWQQSPLQSFFVPCTHATEHTKLNQLCQAAQQPGSFQASSDLPASSSSSSSNIPASQPHVDDSRKASNAAASTSASPANETGPDGSSFRQFLSQPAKALRAFLRRIAHFLKSFPAYIQREKLQRLHKKALDEPTNAERYNSYKRDFVPWGSFSMSW